MKKIIITSFLSILISQWAMAHGVHESGHAKPQRGGVLKSLETVNLELVHIGKQIRIYIYSTDKKPLALNTKDYPVSAKAIFPRGKGSEKINLTAAKDHWTATYDAKKMHRYDFELSIHQGGHDDKIIFTIEPKK